MFLRSVDPAFAERDRQLIRSRLLRDRSGAQDVENPFIIVFVDLPPDLSVQAAFSLIECYIVGSLRVRVAGLER